MDQQGRLLVLRQRQRRLGAGLERERPGGVRLRLQARIVGDALLPFRRGREQLVRAHPVLGRFDEAVAVLVARIVDRRRIFGRRRRPHLLGGIAAALLAGLRQVLGAVRAVDVLVRVGNDGDFERYGVTEILEHRRVEGHADDQDAVQQRGQEQHGRQPVRRRVAELSEFLERVGF